ncbi:MULTISPECIES: FGGY-family carbohydrate kinase [unclassified Erwinia]|uniref:FGGY-family carbohydrate kinase n=1 Tax=unclassified Erwinia TaxID=2622719 RepID=UPI0006F39937|nr:MULTISPECIES: FGGY-family carbohydrate kinase [unclassified Erwinia]KQN57825.1 xylulose kinase [Erwinia sp. Leaf53]PLV58923.1 xylulose kinase [Erwinia sp. B116]
MSYWLGLDCGGTFIKAGLYNAQGRELAVARQSLPVLVPEPGRAERDLHQLWQQAATVIRQVLENSGLDAAQVAGVGISAQGKGLFLLDKQGEPLGNGILSSDRRALALVQQWQRDGVPAALYPVTRQTLWTGHPVSLLRWVKLHEPQRYAAIGSVLMAHDYLRYRLTGELACEETNISESNLYDMQQGDFSPALAQRLGIAEILPALPAIIGSAAVAGTVTAGAAALCGLKPGTPVVGGLFDVVSTALCAGLDDDTRINAVMGTWSVTSGITDRLSDEVDYPFVYGRYAIDGQYIIHEASPTSAANLEWFCQQWGLNDYPRLNQWVAELPPAASSLLFVPFLYGNNAGGNLHASFYGLQAAHQRGHLLQAIYEGVVFAHLTHLNRIRQRFPRVTALRLSGGPTRSACWMQMFADISGLPVEIPQIEESGCLGAALVAMTGTGAYPSLLAAQQTLAPEVVCYQPDAERHRLYQQKYQRYQRLVAALTAVEQETTP